MKDLQQAQRDQQQPPRGEAQILPAGMHAVLAEACAACRSDQVNPAWDYATRFHRMHLDAMTAPVPVRMWTMRMTVDRRRVGAALAQGCLECWQGKASDAARLYALQFLVKHLAEGLCWDELEGTLTDLSFLEAKNEAAMVFGLAADFKLAVDLVPATRPQSRILRLLMQALCGPIDFIARHAQDYPQALFQCLWNSGWWYDGPESVKHCPQNMLPLHESGASLAELLRRWLREKRLSGASFPWARSLRPPQYRLGHQCECINSDYTPKELSISADSRVVAFPIPTDNWSTADSVRVVALDSQEPVRQFSPNPEVLEVLSVCFARDRDFLVILGRGGGARQSVSTETSLGPSNSLAALAAMFTATRATRLPANCIEVWHLPTGRMLLHRQINSFGYKPRISRHAEDHKVILEIGRELCAFDVLSGESHPLTSFPIRGYDFAVSPDGRFVGSTDDHHQIQITDLANGMVVDNIILREIPMSPAAFSPTARRLALICSDRVVRIWDLHERRFCYELSGHLDTIWDADFISEDCLVSGDYKVHLWTFAANITHEAIDPPVPNYLHCIRAVPRASEFLFSTVGGGLHRFRTADRRKIPELIDHEDIITYIGASDSGGHILTGSLEGGVGVWDALYGTLIRMWRPHADTIVLVKESPRAGIYVTASYDDLFKLFKSDSEEEFLSGRCYGVDRIQVGFSADGRYFTIRRAELSLSVWDLHTRSEILIIPLSDPPSPSFVFSNDARLLAVDDVRAIQIWDLDSKKIVQKLHKNAWSADLQFLGKDTIGAAMKDGKMKLWDVATGEVIRELSVAVKGEHIEAQFSGDLKWCMYRRFPTTLVFRTDGSEMHNLALHDSREIDGLAGDLSTDLRAAREIGKVFVEPGHSTATEALQRYLVHASDSLPAVRLIGACGRHLRIVSVELAEFSGISS